MRAASFFSFFFSVAPLVLVACSAHGRFNAITDGGESNGTADAGRDATTSSKPNDAGMLFDPDAQLAGRTCERPIDVGALTLSMASCYVNEHVSNRSGTLTFPCEGGAASIEFSGKKFSGTVDGDEVHLELVEPFTFNNCQWESTEWIDGDLTTGKLDYRYKERPLAACKDTPCTADGKLTVESGAVVVVK